jgi:sulfatase maturation enzyme AslB (radical SAM superfamily)
MKDYVAVIADKINLGEKIVIFSVGGDTLNIVRALKQRFDVLPTVCCDNDPEKQNRIFKGMYGIECLPPPACKVVYPDAFWFVSTLDYKYQILGQLISRLNIPENRIINFEPVKKRLACPYIEKSLICDEQRRFSFCCYQPEGLPAIPFDGAYDRSLADFLALRERLSESYDGECGDCCFMKEDYYPIERKLRWINYGIGGICNFGCTYCNSNARYARSIDTLAPKLSNLIDYLDRKDILAEDYGINIAPGEPTIHPDRKDIFKCLHCYSNVINTNLRVFSKQLYEITSKRFTKLVVSIDSGTPETFESIKGVRCLDRICENLKRYNNAGIGVTVLKYVFIPNVNDNERDVDAFAEICERTDCLIGNISYDYNSPLPIPERTVSAMRRLRKNLDDLNILCTSNIVYSPSDYVKSLSESLNRSTVAP